MINFEQPNPADDSDPNSATEADGIRLSQEISAPAQSLEQELEEISAAIDEAWDLLEPSFRYLADR